MSPSSLKELTWSVLHVDRHLVVQLDEARGVVRYQRTDIAFATAEEVEASHRDVFRALAVLKRPQLGLLVDLRATPESGASEGPTLRREAMERAMAKLRPELLKGFGRLAFLVRSAVGELQLDRHLRNDGFDALVTREEAAALRHLLTQPTG